MEGHAVYFSGAVNQTTCCLDCWKSNGLVCYASSQNLSVFDIKKAQVIGVSPAGHSRNVTCVRCVKDNNTHSKLLVISTSSDATCRLWCFVKSDSNKVYHALETISVLEGHTSTINVGDAIYLDGSDDKVLIATTGDDHTLRTWLVTLSDGSTESCCLYKLPKRSLLLDIRLMNITGASWPLIACGCDDGRINLMTASGPSSYTTAVSLPGHQDWVTALDFMIEDNNDLLLASGAKDGLIRLWRISPHDEKMQGICDAEEDYELKVKPLILSVPSSESIEVKLTCSLESVLQSHEGMVSDLCWVSSIIKDGVSHQSYSLLSCAKTEDRSIILWQPEDETENNTGLWVESTRLGEVGGNREGFSSSKLACDGLYIVSVSYQGGIHLWKKTNLCWEPQLAVSGHFDEVVDVSWDKKGRYLLSTSKDQTTRLYATWINSDNEEMWHELSRPQVHGYDMSCIISLDDFRFASGAEEKLIRGFTAPANFIRNFGHICGLDVDDIIDNFKETEGALIPSLGLSNKAVTVSDIDHQKNHDEPQKHGDYVQAFKSLSLSEPPTEDQLMQGTLWPEESKLYGHGNELLALASSSDGSILASSCRAKTAMDANIILWNTRNWQQIGNLSHHNLSVTQIAFSHDDQYILSVSRDRSWAVYKLESERSYELFDKAKKKDFHGRVIWSCCWVPDNHKFITGSRDKTVAIWCPVVEEDIQTWVRDSVFCANNEVTAVAAARIPHDNDTIILAVGLVDGNVILVKYNEGNKNFSDQMNLSPHHKKTVRRLQFKPFKLDSTYLTLASCADDNSLWIYKINVK